MMRRKSHWSQKSKTTDAEKLEYVLEHLFPLLEGGELEIFDLEINGGASIQEATDSIVADYLGEAEDSEQFISQLSEAIELKKGLSAEELDKLFLETKTKEQQRQENELRAANKRLFSEKIVTWTEKASWTVHEAVALSLERAPDKVDARGLKSRNAPPWAAEYLRRYDLLHRAAGVGDLGPAGKAGHIPPKRFVKWAKRVEMACPDELHRALSFRAGAASTPDETDPRKLHTSYRIILCLAKKHYGFDFSPQLISRVAREISHVLVDTDSKLAVHEKTVKEHLKAAADWAIERGKAKRTDPAAIFDNKETS